MAKSVILKTTKLLQENIGESSMALVQEIIFISMTHPPKTGSENKED